MPSPLIHVAAGYALYRLSRPHAPQPTAVSPSPLLAASIGFSLLPDIDAGVGILSGQFGRFHNNLTHSFFVGVATAVTFALFMRRRGQPFGFWFVLAAIGYNLHVFIDGLGGGRGVMALWPLTAQRFASPVPFFYGLHWSDGWLSNRHFWTLVTESAFVALLVAALHWTKRPSP